MSSPDVIHESRGPGRTEINVYLTSRADLQKLRRKSAPKLRGRLARFERRGPGGSAGGGSGGDVADVSSSASSSASTGC